MTTFNQFQDSLFMNVNISDSVVACPSPINATNLLAIATPSSNPLNPLAYPLSQFLYLLNISNSSAKICTGVEYLLAPHDLTATLNSSEWNGFALYYYQPASQEFSLLAKTPSLTFNQMFGATGTVVIPFENHASVGQSSQLFIGIRYVLNTFPTNPTTFPNFCGNLGVPIGLNTQNPNYMLTYNQPSFSSPPSIILKSDTGPTPPYYKVFENVGSGAISISRATVTNVNGGGNVGYSIVSNNTQQVYGTNDIETTPIVSLNSILGTHDYTFCLSNSTQTLSFVGYFPIDIEDTGIYHFIADAGAVDVTDPTKWVKWGATGSTGNDTGLPSSSYCGVEGDFVDNTFITAQTNGVVYLTQSVNPSPAYPINFVDAGLASAPWKYVDLSLDLTGANRYAIAVQANGPVYIAEVNSTTPTWALQSGIPVLGISWSAVTANKDQGEGHMFALASTSSRLFVWTLATGVWTELTTPVVSGGWTSIAYSQGFNFWTICSATAIYQSLDDGLTWTEVAFEIPGSILSSYYQTGLLSFNTPFYAAGSQGIFSVREYTNEYIPSPTPTDVGNVYMKVV